MLAAWMGRGDLYLSLALLVAARAEFGCARTSKINGQMRRFRPKATGFGPELDGSRPVEVMGLEVAREVKVVSQA